MSVDAGTIYSSIRIKLSDLDKDVSSVTKAFDNVAKSINEAGKSTENLKKFGTAMSTYVTAPTVAAAAAAVKFASDLNESINAVNVVFGESADKILSWGETADKQAGLSQAAFNKAATVLGASLSNAGFSLDDTADLTIKLTQRASDMASVFNTDVDTALVAIQAALRGEADPIEKFGVGLTDATLKAAALSQGIWDGTGELTLYEKATARVAVIMEQTAKVQGDFANTSDGVANGSRIAKAEVINLAAKIGQDLLPIAKEILEAFSKLVSGLSDMDEGTRKTIMTIVGFGAVVGPVTQAVAAINTLKVALTAIATNPAALTLIAIAGGVALVAAQIKKENDLIKEGAEKLGITADAYRELEKLAKQGAYAGSIKQVTTNIDTMAKRLGISTTQVIEFGRQTGIVEGKWKDQLVQVQKNLAGLQGTSAITELLAEKADMRAKAEEKVTTSVEKTAEQLEREKKITDAYNASRELILDTLEGEKTEYEKIQEKIEQLQKTPWAKGELEEDRKEAIEVLKKTLQELAEQEAKESNDAVAARAAEGDAAREAAKARRDAAQLVIDKVADLGKAEVSAAEAAKQSILDQIDATGLGVEQTDELKEKVEEFYKKLEEKESAEKFKENVTEAMEEIIEVINAALDAAVSSANDAYDKEIELAEDRLDVVEELLKKETEALKKELAARQKEEDDALKKKQDAQLAALDAEMQEELYNAGLVEAATTAQYKKELDEAKKSGKDQETIAKLQALYDKSVIKDAYEAKKVALKATQEAETKAQEERQKAEESALEESTASLKKKALEDEKILLKEKVAAIKVLKETAATALETVKTTISAGQSIAKFVMSNFTDYGSLIQGISGLVKEAFNGDEEAAKEFTDKIIELAGELQGLQPILDLLIILLDAFMPILIPLVSIVGDLLKVLSPVFQLLGIAVQIYLLPLTLALGVLSDAFGTLDKVLKSPTTRVGDFFAAVQKIIDSSDSLTGVLSSFQDWFKWLASPVRDANSALNAMPGSIQSILDKKDKFKSFFEDLLNPANNLKNAWDRIVSSFNSLISTIAKAPTTILGKLGFAGGGIIPSFAAGGMIPSYANGGMMQHFDSGGITIVPGASMTGDKVPFMANSGEMVINAEQQSRLFDLLSGRLGDSSNTNNFNIGNFFGTKAQMRQLAEQITPMLTQVNKRRGANE
jgi:hypothetical protein